MLCETESRGSRCTSFNQYYKSKKVQNNFEAILEELIVERKNCEVIEAFFQYMIEKKKTVTKNTNLILFLIVKLLKEKENFITY